MKDAAADCYIDVDLLRVGMYIHLDLGWLSHPFPLSHFKLSGEEQIETLRGLGVRRLRWVPEKSDPECGAVPPAAVPSVPAAAVDDAAETPEAAAKRARKDAITSQREALQACDRKFAEASRNCKAAFDLVATQPRQARANCETLARGLLGKMPCGRDLSIRLLSESAGDKAATHALNVMIISLLMGRVFGLPEDEMLDLGIGALLHDVGKLDLPERVRHRDDHFSPAELGYYQEHVALGVSAGRRMGLSPGALLVIGQHHEHADGTGFPMHLNADRMSLAARIVALVNRYDNLCNPTVVAKALTPHEALSLMFAQGKNKFDPTIMSAFIKMMGVYPPGSIVQLTDDRYALVTAVNSSRPLKPRVMVHDPRVSREDALLLDLELEPGIGIRRSLKPQQLPRDALDTLVPRKRVVYFFEPARELSSLEVAA